MDTQQEKKELSVKKDKKMGIFHESYMLAKQSSSLVRRDPYIIVFPILCSALTIFFLAGFFVVRTLLLGEEGKVSPESLLFLYFIIAFFSMFMKIGVILSLRSYLSNTPILIKDAFKKTAKKIDIIFAWAIVSALVGVTLLILPFDIYSLFVVGILGAYWSLATYFIAPAFSEENAVFSESLTQSIQALRKSWKEMIIINIGFEFLFAVLMVFVLALLGDFIFLFPVIVNALPVFAGISVLFMALLGFSLVFLVIFSALYRVSFNLVLYSPEARNRIFLDKPVKKITRKRIVKKTVNDANPSSL